MDVVDNAFDGFRLGHIDLAIILLINIDAKVILYVALLFSI